MSVTGSNKPDENKHISVYMSKPLLTESVNLML